MKYRDTERIITPIHWEDLLLESNNPYIVPFLKWNGDIFVSEMWNVIRNLYTKTDEVLKKNKTGGVGMDVEVAIHVNCDYLISFKDSDFSEMLDWVIAYYEKKEKYEKCAEIVKFKKEMKSFSKVDESDKLKKEIDKLLS